MKITGPSDISLSIQLLSQTLRLHPSSSRPWDKFFPWSSQAPPTHIILPLTLHQTKRCLDPGINGFLWQDTTEHYGKQKHRCPQVLGQTRGS